MLLTRDEVENLIDRNEILLLAGDERLLKTLAKGRWIAGTIPYFMSEQGGLSTDQKIFATSLPDFIKDLQIKIYAENELSMIPKDAPDSGFSMIILPALSAVHAAYAEKAPNIDGIFFKPIIGWVAGIHLDDVGKITPKVYNGLTGEMSENKAVVMHVTLPKNKIAQIGIINIFKQGDGDTIEFDSEGFSVKECLIDGRKRNFCEYIISNKINTKLPLVANYSGAMVNVSFRAVDEPNKAVHFYAPVFKGVQYKIADPVEDYVKDFTAQLDKERINPLFSCNCILNYLYSELESKKTGNITGPITFGEIAYQLLNQTLTYMEIK